MSFSKKKKINNVHILKACHKTGYRNYVDPNGRIYCQQYN